MSEWQVWVVVVVGLGLLLNISLRLDEIRTILKDRRDGP